MPKINLGDEAADVVTGFTGICTAKTTYISGCTRITLQPRAKDDGTIPEPGHFDEPMCVIVALNKVPPMPSDSGGPGLPVPRT